MSNIHLSKKGERAVSQFVGQELLYDYLRGELDDERRAALEKLMDDSTDLRKELEKVQMGLTYMTTLAQTQVSPQLLEGIRVPTTYFQTMLRKAKFEDWPEGVKLAFEGLVVALGSLIVILVVPWGRLANLKSRIENNSITLSEVTKAQYSESEPTASVATNDPNAKSKENLFEDETLKPGDGKTKPPVKVAAAVAAAETAKPTPATPAQASPTAEETVATETVKEPARHESGAPDAALAAPQVSPAVEQQAPVVAAAASPSQSVASTKVAVADTASDSSDSAESVSESATTKVADKKSQGFLYRGSIQVTNLPAVTPKLVEFMTSNGGRKAGEVELGWKKGESSYFHFTIPAAKYQAMVDYLKEYGALKISKEPHPRVMPDGIVRVILTVDEKR